MTEFRAFGQVVSTVLITVLGVIVGWILFVQLPAGSMTRLIGILLVLAFAAAITKIASKILSHIFATYNVAEISIEGPIRRQGGGLPTQPAGTSADDIVQLIEKAQSRDAIDALIIKLNTNGGQVLPSEDIRRAVAEFDGPTAAYITDTCASGGYWIATGCDMIYARQQSMIGSIGVTGSKVNANDLMERLGVSYFQFTAGQYKDAGNTLKDITADEQQYLQGLVDRYYDEFIDRVCEGRGLQPEEIVETEARMYLAPEAQELGLIDEIGARDAIKRQLADELGKESVSVSQLSQDQSLSERLSIGVNRLCYSFGAGIATVWGPEHTSEIKLR